MRIRFQRFTIKLIALFFLSIFCIYLIQTLNHRNNIIEIEELVAKSDVKKVDGLVCMILASEKSIATRGLAVWQTWSKHCAQTLFACRCDKLKQYKQMKAQKRENIPPEYLPYESVADMPILDLNINDNYNNMGEKVFLTLKLTYEKFSTHNWFIMADDDTYIFTENLEKFMKEKSSSEPFLYGFKFNVIVPNGYLAGGPGNFLISSVFTQYLFPITV